MLTQSRIIWRTGGDVGADGDEHVDEGGDQLGQVRAEGRWREAPPQVNHQEVAGRRH